VVQALNVLGLPAGARTNASIRPERLALAPAGEGMMTLTVREMIYFGDHLRVVLDRDGLEMMAKAPIDRATGLAPGDPVSVTWDARHCRALDVGSADAHSGAT
jgi:ABC-type Fe3+/spermidine/putrescine transport system ATPase subunit